MQLEIEKHLAVVAYTRLSYYHVFHRTIGFLNLFFTLGMPLPGYCSHDCRSKSVLTSGLLTSPPNQPDLTSLRDFLFASAKNMSQSIRQDERKTTEDGLEGLLITSTASANFRGGGNCSMLKKASKRVQGEI